MNQKQTFIFTNRDDEKMFFFEGEGIIFTEVRFSINWLNCDIFAGFMFNKTKTNHFKLPFSCIFFYDMFKGN